MLEVYAIQALHLQQGIKVLQARQAGVCWGGTERAKPACQQPAATQAESSHPSGCLLVLFCFPVADCRSTSISTF